MLTTAYFEDFLDYYDKAYALQERNISSPTGRDPGLMDVFGYEELHVADPLMHFITIYDCVERRYAGFSNALQQVWFGSENPKRWQIDARFDGMRDQLATIDWLWVFLVHRVTGSGASFSHDHGFRNSIVADMVLRGPQAGDMKRYLLSEMRQGRAVFTSIGNQIPPFPKPYPPFSRGSELYLSEFAPRLCWDMWQWLTEHGGPRMSVQAAADKACALHREYGVKQFKFVLTAWAMDIAEYMPHYVDPHSHVHYGKNALESLNLLFEDFSQKRAEQAMDRITSALHERGYPREILKPYSLEDVLCDYVRYIEHYVPKGYEHLKPHHVENVSRIKHIHTVRHASYHDVHRRHGHGHQDVASAADRSPH